MSSRSSSCSGELPPAATSMAERKALVRNGTKSVGSDRSSLPPHGPNWQGGLEEPFRRYAEAFHAWKQRASQRAEAAWRERSKLAALDRQALEHGGEHSLGILLAPLARTIGTGWPVPLGPKRWTFSQCIGLLDHFDDKVRNDAAERLRAEYREDLHGLGPLPSEKKAVAPLPQSAQERNDVSSMTRFATTSGGRRPAGTATEASDNASSLADPEFLYSLAA